MNLVSTEDGGFSGAKIQQPITQHTNIGQYFIRNYRRFPRDECISIFRIAWPLNLIWPNYKWVKNLNMNNKNKMNNDLNC